MYTIRKEENCLPTKVILNRSTSFGLGLTVFQLCLELHKILELAENEVEGNINCSGGGGGTCTQLSRQGGIATINTFQTGVGATAAAADNNIIDKESVKLQLPVQFMQQDFRGFLIIGVIFYAKVVLSLVDIYSFAVVRVAVHKESLCDTWLGLYLQIAFLTYNMAEILIGAYKGTFESFDESSVFLAAMRASVRAISIEMICVFLREIKVKQETEMFFYSVLNL